MHPRPHWYHDRCGHMMAAGLVTTQELEPLCPYIRSCPHHVDMDFCKFLLSRLTAHLSVLDVNCILAAIVATDHVARAAGSGLRYRAIQPIKGSHWAEGSVCHPTWRLLGAIDQVLHPIWYRNISLGCLKGNLQQWKPPESRVKGTIVFVNYLISYLGFIQSVYIYDIHSEVVGGNAYSTKWVEDWAACR